MSYQDNKFEWTPERVQEFTAIYAGNFCGKKKRFKHKDFLGLRYHDKVKMYQKLVYKLEGKDERPKHCVCPPRPSFWARLKGKVL